MDPNQLLNNIRWYIDYLLDEDNDDPERTAGIDLALCVQDMDDWLSRGGLIPHDWKVAGK